MFKMGVYFGSEGGFHECRIYICLKGGRGRFWGVFHIVAQKVVYSGGMGRLWEGRISKGRGYILRGRSRFWEGGIDSGSVTLHKARVSILGGRGRFRKGRI